MVRRAQVAKVAKGADTSVDRVLFCQAWPRAGTHTLGEKLSVMGVLQLSGARGGRRIFGP